MQMSKTPESIRLYAAAVGTVWHHMTQLELFASHQPATALRSGVLPDFPALHVCRSIPFRDFVYYYHIY